MEYHIEIGPDNERTKLNLGEVWRYRDLIVLLTRKSFRLTYKQTILGPLWIVLNPIMYSIAYMIVFGVIAGIETEGVPQILFYLLGTAVWGLFSYSLTSNSRTFISNASVFSKVYFPRLTVPISNIFVGVIQFGIQMIMVFAIIVFYVAQGAIAPRWILWLTIPVSIVHLCLLGMGIGIILSSLTTKYRDLQILVGFGMQLWMFATPVVYPLSQVPEGALRIAVMCNPVTQPVEWMRYVLLGVGDIDPVAMTVSIIVTLVCAVCGILMFNRVERTFIDTV